MRGSFREISWPVVVSVALHGLLVGTIVLAGLWSVRRSPPVVEPLPIDAVVIDSQVLHAAERAKTDKVVQEAARVQAIADAKAAADAKTAADAEAQAEDEAKAEAAEQQRAADAAKALSAQKAAQSLAQAAAQQRADADKAVRAAQQAQAAAAVADAKKAADAKASGDAKAAADRTRKDREADLKRQIAEDEHRSAVEAGPMRDRYIASLRNKIQNAWNKPPSARVGIDCLVEVTQVPGGEVTNAHVTQCNGDSAVRQSIENAVYRASPLPDPPDQSLFEKNFVFRFRPNE